MSVIGVASSTPDAKAKKRQSSEESKEVIDRKTDSSVKDKGKSVKKSPAKTSKLTDNKLEQLDQEWSERFSRLEAMLLSKTFTQLELVFQSVVVPPPKPPPAGAVDYNQPLFQPQNDQPTASQQKPTSLPATIHQQPAHQPETDNWPCSIDQHLQLTNPLATTLSSLLTSLSLTTDLLLPALTGHRLANQRLTISSHLTSVRLITFLVLHLLTSNRPMKQPSHRPKTDI